MGYWEKKEDRDTRRQEPMGDPVGNLADLEQACEQELSQVNASFRERMKAENDRFRDMCDTEYWCCVCFNNRAQREEFLRSVGFDPDEKYIDGKELARAIKRPVKTPDMEFARTRPFDRDFIERSKPL